MTTAIEAIERLGALRDAAEDPGAAYLIRSRLRRALLSCARLVAEREGVQKPVLPGQWALSDDASEEARAALALCRRIYQNAAHLCQPSESFDVRWEEGWSQLQLDLEELEGLLHRLPG